MTRNTAAVLVRRATAEDERDVRRCVIAAYQRYVADIGKEPAPMVADYTALIAGGLVRVAVDGDVLLGVIVMWPEPDHLYVDNVAVMPEAQGRGIGTLLLGVADGEARRAGLGEIRLYTNEKMTANLSYYPRHGFTETHRAEAEGYQRVYFRRIVDPAPR